VVGRYTKIFKIWFGDRISACSIQNELDFLIEVKVKKKEYFFYIHNHPFNLHPEKGFEGCPPDFFSDL